jgi:hypothetical protein
VTLSPNATIVSTRRPFGLAVRRRRMSLLIQQRQPFLSFAVAAKSRLPARRLERIDGSEAGPRTPAILISQQPAGRRVWCLGYPFA